MCAAQAGLSALLLTSVSVAQDSNASDTTSDTPTNAPDTQSEPAEKPKTFWRSHLPEPGLAELGLFAGVLFVSRVHNLQEERFPHQVYELPAWLFGARGAYFPWKFAGVELEYTAGTGGVEGRVARFSSARGHVVAQLDRWRLVPFVLMGAGFLKANSDEQGNDADFLFQAGLGAKFAVSRLVALRLDFREDMLQREGGGVSFSEEVLLGVSLTLGR
jgi:hypothetical protein